MVQSVLGSLILGYRPLWNRARKLAGDFFSNMCVFLHLAGDKPAGSDCDNLNYLNLVVNTEQGAASNVK